MTVSMDVASTISALFWPVVVLVVLLAYRKRIPTIVGGLASRVTKLEVAGVSIEMAVAKPFVPNWSGTPQALDLRHTAVAMQVNDSYARTFSDQLTAEGTADYALLDLGFGQEWLTSRLYIMAILFEMMKGVKCIVFLERSGDVRKRYVGWAKPETMRWALAKRYPWLETAFADAYSALTSQQTAVIVNNEGRLAYPYAPRDAGASLELLRQYLERVQSPPPVPPTPLNTSEWVPIDSATNTHEHAQWISSELLEEILGDDLNTSVVPSAELRTKNNREQLRLFLAVPERFVAVTSEERRFEYLVDRNVLLEQLAKSVSTEVDGRN